MNGTRLFFQCLIIIVGLVGIIGSGSGGSEAPPPSGNIPSPTPEQPAESILPSELVTALGLNIAGSTDNFNGDTDGDGLSDDFEIMYTSETISPKLNDTDENGISDADQDTDSDGLTNLEEQEYQTNPLNADSDQDGLTDWDEINTYETSPNNADMDEDGLSDEKEIHLGLNPKLADSDGDGVNDAQQPIYVEISLAENTQDSITLNIAPEEAISISTQPVIQNEFITSNNQLIIELPETIELDDSDDITLNLALAKAEYTQFSVIYGLNPITNLWVALAEPFEHQYDENTEILSLTTTLANLPFNISNNSEVSSSNKTAQKSFSQSAQTLNTVPFANNFTQLYFVSGKVTEEEIGIQPVISHDFLQDDLTNVKLSEFSARKANMYLEGINENNPIEQSNSGALILNENQWLKIKANEVITTGNYTVIAYFEYSNAQGTFLTNQTDNQSEYTYSYTTNSFTDWTALTFIRNHYGLYSYRNSERTEFIQGNHPTAKEYFYLGKPLSLCDTDIDSSSCQNNTQFQGSLAKVEVYDRLIGRKQIREKLFKFYYDQFGTTDTDGDGLIDAEELAGINSNEIYSTSRFLADTDGDLLDDSDEIEDYIAPVSSSNITDLIQTKRTYFSNPTKKDTDDDGLSDYVEFSVGSSPLTIDSDNDGLTDAQELEIDTDPLSKDTDVDGINDGIEFRASSLNLDPTINDTVNLGRVPTSVQSLVHGGVNNSYINTSLATYNNYLSLTSNQKIAIGIKAGLVASELNNAKVMNIFWGAVEGAEIEPENGYESLGKILGIAASFIPVADIPLALRDAAINVFQGDFASAGLDFASILPIAGTVVDTAKVTEDTIKVASKLKNVEPQSIFKMLSILLNSAKIPEKYKLQWIGSIIGAELIITGSEILFTDLEENSSSVSARSTVSQSQKSSAASAKTIKLSATQLLQLVKGTTPAALKLLLKQMADNKILVRQIPSNTAGIKNGFFVKLDGKKHWVHGEDWVEAMIKKDFENALEFDTQLALCASGLNLKCGNPPINGVKKSIKGMRKADAAALLANGPPKQYALREAKVGMVYNSKRIRQEIRRDCKMLNGRPSGKNKDRDDVEVVNIEWHLMPSGGSNAKFRMGASEAVLDALQCKGFGVNAKAITVVANLVH